MHDPLTVAFEIKSPFGQDGVGEYKYHPSIITIWHKDPLKFKDKLGCRDDDSCGWFRPPYSPEDHDRICKMAKEHYSSIFERQAREAEGASYANICFVPTVYDAVYWSWRALKHRDKKGWRYGNGRNVLTTAELQEIYCFANNPIDNLRCSFAGVKDEESFTHFFFIVYRCYGRFHRPWYKHPRWHVHHWKIQFHPWQNLRRRFWDKCCKCGKRGFPKGVHAMGDWGGTRIWHSTCDDVAACSGAD